VTQENLKLWISLPLLFSIVISCSSILVPWCPYPLLVLECKGVSKMRSFLNFDSSPPRDFILPSPAEAQAQAFATNVSPPSVRNCILYDLVVKTFIDDEDQKWIGCLCVEFEGGPLWHEPLCGP
jgi:hypothetical protein